MKSKVLNRKTQSGFSVKNWLLAGGLGSVLFLSLNSFAKNEPVNRPNGDIGVINIERIEYWLKKSGQLSEKASEQEVQVKIGNFVQGISGYREPSKLLKAKQRAIKRKVAKQKVTGEKTLQKAAAPKTVKVLAVLIDFPDLKHDSHGLNSGDTDMYYPSYPVSHYRDVMFSTTGFEGPGGETLLSGYQYYQRESGGEFFFTGEVFDWVTADKNAAEYGGHAIDPQSGRDINDKGVEELIKEAVEKAVAANSINLAEYDVEDPYDSDEDGIFDEADGYIDHVMVFHSSIGEEAGGGRLLDDAIWSHRFYVDAQGTEGGAPGYQIPGTDKSVYGYTIQPIDAAPGVIVHEFGHDLGLPDEYDIGEANSGSPVGYWSVMAGGSWAGELAGTEPTGFSSYAKEYLQENHGANWISQSTLDFETFTDPVDIELVDATDTAGALPNVIKVNLPAPMESFKQPFSGEYQYYSARGHDLSNQMSFEVSIPDSDNVSFTMKAHWEIEEDWDFVKVTFNDTSLPGNYTREANPYTGQYPGYDDAVHYITASSATLAEATGANNWVDLSFDVSSLKGQTVTVKFEYRTDSNTGGYGFVADDLKVVDGNSEVFVDDAEAEDSVTLNGFLREDNQTEGAPQNYWLQLRSHNGNDSGLISAGYDHGLVIWFSDSEFGTNESSIHPGRGFVSVVDTDQNMIAAGGSSRQIRDAALRTFEQTAYSGDSSLTAVSVFDDGQDYSTPAQPESGVILPNAGLSVELISQDDTSQMATIRVSKIPTVATSRFRADVSGSMVAFRNRSSGPNPLTFSWDFGDGSAASSEYGPVYTYASEGIYDVTLTVTDSVSGDIDSFTQKVEVGSAPVSSFSFTASDLTVNFTNTTTGGIGTLRYQWNFGDGTSSTQKSPVHTYSAAGTFTVILTTIDGANISHSSSQEVTVQESSGGDTGGGDSSNGSSSSGGGSLGWVLVLVSIFGIKRRRQ
ncbi:immune inhibitor A domain-containing protein [Aliikangiella sp. G2MR2-5]|uniref:immune inhibitor A domain-containing protein n=1 Tax=Aliikangiella sp. G2MR2-5 TaxID=2788943 RepID=UPI0018A8D6F3|nr:immune inhibitor A domain-containing protein [Aliikangiella sp. G2MR2-5]